MSGYVPCCTKIENELGQKMYSPKISWSSKSFGAKEGPWAFPVSGKEIWNCVFSVCLAAGVI